MKAVTRETMVKVVSVTERGDERAFDLTVDGATRLLADWADQYGKPESDDRMGQLWYTIEGTDVQVTVYGAGLPQLRAHARHLWPIRMQA